MIEFFSADCRLCEACLAVLRERFPGLEMVVHRAAECSDGSCCRRAESYGVRAVPALVVNGKIVLTSLPTEEDLRRLEPLLGGGQLA